MPDDIRAGWAIYRYIPDQQECSPFGEFGTKSWGDTYGCCPSGTVPKKAGRVEHCDKADTKGDTLPQQQCANSTWTLFTTNTDNPIFFCCDNGNDRKGYYYASEPDKVGCANGTWIANAESDVRTAGTYPQPTGKPSTTNKGAIAGGVVGGVCGAFIIVGLIWFFYRRRRQSTTPTNEEVPWPSKSSPNSPRELEDHGPEPSEISGSNYRKEMPADMQPAQELAGDTQNKPPTELP